MSTRHIRFDHDPGDYVLCFEPDTTKARVLYDAKIIEQQTSKDPNGKRKAEYHIHFQGWNNSWDRTVPASFVLKNTDKNRSLMKRLASVARHVNNKKRNRKINSILKHHFGRLPKFDSSDSSEEEEEEDSSSDEDNDVEDSKDVDLDNVDSEDGEVLQKMEDVESEEAESPVEEDMEETGPAKPPKIDLPESLKKKLEDDCYMIKRKKKLVKLPADPNVVTILEAYVKNFALNLIYGTVEKRPYPARESVMIAPERSVDLCKEVMDGLRVFFDFTLSTALLYESEMEQFDSALANFKPASSRDVLDAQSPLVNSPRMKPSSKCGGSPARAESSPKIPRLSPKSIKEEIVTEEEENGDEELPCKRMTRHAYQEELKKETTTRSGKKSQGIPNPRRSKGQAPSKDGTTAVTANRAAEEQCTKRRDSLRSSHRHTSISSQENEQETVPTDKKTGMFERITPPPPLLIPNAISSKGGSSHSSQSPVSTPTQLSNSGANREAALNRILEWKLIPDEVYDESPPPASVVYGAQHLLRLFITLPEYLAQMSIPTVKLKNLVKHLEMFLEYLSDRSEELFQESCYTDAGEHSSSTKQTRK